MIGCFEFRHLEGFISKNDEFRGAVARPEKTR
jgi:hypothetical protein